MPSTRTSRCAPWNLSCFVLFWWPRSTGVSANESRYVVHRVVQSNKKIVGARHLQYLEFLQYFTWNINERVWKPKASIFVRQLRNDISSCCKEHLQYSFTQVGARVVSMFYSVSPKEQEIFYLRTLLLHVKGAITFGVICEVNGAEIGSSRDTCKGEDFWNMMQNGYWFLQMQLEQHFCHSQIYLPQY